MKFSRVILLLALAGSSASALADDCRFDDRAGLLAMTPEAFNRGPGEGWDALIDRSGCQREIADLFAAYRRQAKATGHTELTWHEAQLRADAGQRDPASALMRLTYRPRNADPDGWNLYVDATIAFLDDDLPALRRMRARLAALPPPAGRGLSDGPALMQAADGTQAVPWPPRLKIVDALIRCMYQPYALASGSCPEP
ncbi:MULTISPECIES: hypothetical protein [Stenotrophomonas]|uniref:hypothetical protein n=1 Tax=Stenotrophomonas TaxID=40323 RepID=UPI0018D2B8FE|nr:hypothetical protein [Stenotrophomonas sp.]MBH1507531.1 hypothetical protein [Stenotrophomonas maltophilia]